MIAEPVLTETAPEPPAGHVVRLAFPGHTFCYGAVQGILQATGGTHTLSVSNSGTGWDDFNACWCDALNAYERGEVTHFAMLHADIAPQPGWLDVLLEELDRRELDLVSAVAPIKDYRGLTSSGIGDPADRWRPFRRFTVREVCAMPETFTAAEVGYADKYLLHNTGCWACDLRNPLFRQTDAEGTLRCFFDFPRRSYRDPDSGAFAIACESEDWYFSRQIAALGARTAITRKVRLAHRGAADFPNNAPWGRQEHDEDTAYKWRPAP